MTEQKVEQTLETSVHSTEQRDISLERIAWTTIGYGLAGSFFPDAYLVAPVTAVAGFGLSVYDELKRKGMNLVLPAAGILVGGLIGSAFDIDSNKYLPHVLVYGGATLGGALGMLKSFISRERSEERDHSTCV